MTTDYSEPIMTYIDRNYPLGELEVSIRGDFLRIEYSPDGYMVDAIYIPFDPLYKFMREY